MISADPRVRTLVNQFIPGRAVVRDAVVSCSTNPLLSHLVVTSYGVSNERTLGTMFEIVSLPPVCNSPSGIMQSPAVPSSQGEEMRPSSEAAEGSDV